MPCEFYPLQVLISMAAGWVNRHQEDVIDYLVEENRALKDQLGGKRLRLTDDQRRRLAAKGKRLGTRVLRQVCSIVTPETILRWHRTLIAAKWTFRRARVGRPGVMKEIARLALLMARENSGWGYTRIQGALQNLGHRVARSTIAKVLRDNGIEPAPSRPSSWRTFLRAHWGEIVGADFFTTEVWTASGLKTYYVFFLIDLETRRVCVAGITQNPNAGFMVGMARILLDPCSGFLRAKRFLILDRDRKYTACFKSLLRSAGVEIIQTPHRAPNCNAYAERFVRSIKAECLDRMILFGEGHLERAIGEYLGHYHRERNHQGLGNRLIAGPSSAGGGEVGCTERLGGLLRFYHRAAA